MNLKHQMPTNICYLRGRPLIECKFYLTFTNKGGFHLMMEEFLVKLKLCHEFLLYPCYFLKQKCGLYLSATSNKVIARSLRLFLEKSNNSCSKFSEQKLLTFSDCLSRKLFKYTILKKSVCNSQKIRF